MRKDTRIVFTLPYNKTTEILEWCKENFGPKHRKRWGHTSLSNPSPSPPWPARSPVDFYINNIEDAMAFKLRWL